MRIATLPLPYLLWPETRHFPGWFPPEKNPWRKKKHTWQFFVPFLGWLNDPFEWLSDLQLGDEKGHFESPGTQHLPNEFWQNGEGVLPLILDASKKLKMIFLFSRWDRLVPWGVSGIFSLNRSKRTWMCKVHN